MIPLYLNIFTYSILCFFSAWLTAINITIILSACHTPIGGLESLVHSVIYLIIVWSGATSRNTLYNIVDLEDILLISFINYHFNTAVH